MPPTCPAPTVSGPRCFSSHCAPMAARPNGLRTWSLSDIRFFSLTITRAW
jgi:hypothetical protein